MRVNEKIERITADTLICGIDVGKKMCCARFCDFRGLEVYHKVWFDRTKKLDAIGCQITAAMYKENKNDVIIAFEPTGHYWLNVDKYFKDCGQETVLMPTYTVKQAKEMNDQNPTKSDPKDAMLIARLTSEGKYVKPIERDELYQDIYSGYHIYDDISKEINRIRNKIHVWNDKYFPEVEKELIKLASQIDYVEKAVEITGVGYMSMVGIIAETGDLRNYEHAKQVLKISGLSLKES